MKIRHLSLYGLLLTAACQTAPSPVEQPAPSTQAAVLERMTGVPGVGRLYRMGSGMYRGSQPSAEGYQQLRKLGIKTVVSFRRFTDSRGQAEAAGLRYHALPIYASLGSEPPSPGQLARFLQIVRDPSQQPVFIHCAHGRDRTGVMSAVFRMECQGWPRRRALAEMKELGFRRIFRDLYKFVRRYEVRESATQ